MNLSELAYQIRIIGKLVAIVFAIILVFYFLIVIMINTLKKPKLEQAYINPTFGSIDRLVFETTKNENRKFKFILDTIDGSYPTSTASANVYYIPEPKSTLAYLNRIQAIAESFGFDIEQVKPEQINENWIKFEDIDKTININIKNYHFHFLYKSTKNLQELVEATPEARFTYLEDGFIETAREVLSTRDSYPSQLAAGKTNIVYQRYDLAQKQFVSISSGDVPQAVRVDFFRQAENLPIVPPEYFVSQNYVVLAPLIRYPEIVEAKFNSFNILTIDPGVYPLISSEEAWQSLNKNQAKIVSLADDAKDLIHIKEYFVSYYDPLDYQAYFQPIFVFLGDHEYVGYLPAIQNKFLAQ